MKPEAMITSEHPSGLNVVVEEARGDSMRDPDVRQRTFATMNKPPTRGSYVRFYYYLEGRQCWHLTRWRWKVLTINVRDGQARIN
jgi:hypothetical protein